MSPRRSNKKWAAPVAFKPATCCVHDAITSAQWHLKTRRWPSHVIKWEFYNFVDVISLSWRPPREDTQWHRRSPRRRSVGGTDGEPPPLQKILGKQVVMMMVTMEFSAHRRRCRVSITTKSRTRVQHPNSSQSHILDVSSVIQLTTPTFQCCRLNLIQTWDWIQRIQSDDAECH